MHTLFESFFSLSSVRYSGNRSLPEPDRDFVNSIDSIIDLTSGKRSSKCGQHAFKYPSGVCMTNPSTLSYLA